MFPSSFIDSWKMELDDLHDDNFDQTFQKSTEIVEEKWENERIFPRRGWSKPSPLERQKWTSESGRVDRSVVVLPSESWEWKGEWMADVHNKTDENGWQYSFNWRGCNWHGKTNKIACVRRRKWTRTRMKVDRLRKIQEELHSVVIASLQLLNELVKQLIKTSCSNSEAIAAFNECLHNIAIPESASVLFDALGKCGWDEKDEQMQEVIRFEVFQRDLEVIIDTMSKKWIHNKETKPENQMLTATKSGDYDAVSDLLKSAPALVNLKEGGPPLRWTAKEGNLEISRLLISCKADVNLVTDSGKSALHFASSWGHIKIIELLVESNADVDLLDSKHKQSPLFGGVQSGSVDVVKLLLLSKSNINSQNKDGETSLFHAVKLKQFEITKLLISAHAEVHAQDFNGNTAMSLAARLGCRDITSLLIEAGSQTNIKHKFMSAVMNDNKNEVNDLLSLIPGIINSTCEDGCTALHWATSLRYSQMVRLLVENRCDINARDENNKQTPLHLATEARDIEIVKLLVFFGADMDIQDKHGQTAIDVAVNQAMQDEDNSLQIFQKYFCVSESKFISTKHLANISKLSSGHFGVTFQAEWILQKKSDRIVSVRVVCKVPKMESGTDDWFELQALKNLRHRNVLGLLALCMDFSVSEGVTKPALVVPFEEGGSLRQYLDMEDKEKPFELPRMISFGIDMIASIVYLHEHNFIHRDIAARNFLLTEKEQNHPKFQRLVLADFGLTRPFHVKSSFTSLQRATSYKGAPQLLPWRSCPLESFNFAHTKSSDIWMIGVAFWEMLSVTRSRLPFEDITNIYEYVRLLRSLSISDHDTFVPLKMPEDKEPKLWIDLINRCCAIEEEQRPTADEIAIQLKSMQERILQEAALEESVIPKIEFREPSDDEKASDFIIHAEVRKHDPPYSSPASTPRDTLSSKAVDSTMSDVPLPTVAEVDGTRSRANCVYGNYVEWNFEESMLVDT